MGGWIMDGWMDGQTNYGVLSDYISALSPDHCNVLELFWLDLLCTRLRFS